MIRFSSSVAVLSCLSIVGCWTGDKYEEDTADEEEAEVEERVQPESGNWAIITTGWTDDDCNATENLVAPSSLTFSDIQTSSFEITIYDGEIRVGGDSFTCLHDGDDVYDCEDIAHGFAYTDIDAAISMSGPFEVTVMSETTASGKGGLVLECTGSDCGEVATSTNSGSFPCTTTLNWTAEAE